jgi:hypothetical protein
MFSMARNSRVSNAIQNSDRQGLAYIVTAASDRIRRYLQSK